MAESLSDTSTFSILAAFLGTLIPEEFLNLSFDMIYIYITHDDNSLIVWAIPFAVVSTESFWLTAIDNAHQTDRKR